MRKSLYDAVIDKWPHSIREDDFDVISKDVSYYLLQGFTIDECVEAALWFYDRNPKYFDDPAGCFGYGMHEELSH